MDAIRRSSAVVSGKVTEHLAPYIGVFPYNPKDVRFLGAPIDLIVFDGLSEGDLHQIIFLEVKTNTSNLSTRERRIRDVVVARQVAWRELRVSS
jgi:predicted Holliday junction resolvase-like endonuclease